MKIYIRNIEESDAVEVGKMDRTDLSHFIQELKTNGLNVRQSSGCFEMVMPESVNPYFYYDGETDFWVEVLLDFSE